MKKLAWVPCQEEMIEIEQLAKRQKRLFPDAADVGYWVANENAPWLILLRAATRELTKCHGSKIYKTPLLSTVSIFIPIEHDEGLISGEVIEITRQSFKGKPAVIINVHRARLNAQQIKTQYGGKTASQSVLKVAARYEKKAYPALSYDMSGHLRRSPAGDILYFNLSGTTRGTLVAVQADALRQDFNEKAAFIGSAVSNFDKFKATRQNWTWNQGMTFLVGSDKGLTFKTDIVINGIKALDDIPGFLDAIRKYATSQKWYVDKLTADSSF